MATPRWYEFAFVIIMFVSVFGGIFYLNSKTPKPTKTYYNFLKK